jgi:glycosyltransferase involved in cell wall biosynthesis
MYVLSVIFPCYNESSNIVGIISSIKSALQGRNDVEIILVDNGSTDSTPQVLEQALQGEHNKQFKTLRIEKNIGYGYGIMEGVSIAFGEVIAWTHADLQTDPADVLEAYKIFFDHPEYPNCILKGRRVGRNPLDALFTAGMSLFSTALLRVPLSDVNAQPKMFHKSFLKKLLNPPLDFSLDLYLLYQARVNKYQILEHHVNFGKRLYGESKGGGTLKGKLRLIQRTWKYMIKLKSELER